MIFRRVTAGDARPDGTFLDKLIWLIVAMMAATGAAATARMQLPDGFREQADFLHASGFRGRRSGEFRIGAYDGEFSSKDSRLDVGDATWVSNKARNTVRLVHPDTGDSASSSCQLSKGTVTIKIVTFDPTKLRYDCWLELGDSKAQLFVGQAKRSTGQKVLAQDLRSGTALFAGLEMSIRSVHGYDGSRFTSQEPVGYLVESGDRTLAAVELTDTAPSVYLLRDLSADDRYRVMLVAMTIALLPAELE